MLQEGIPVPSLLIVLSSKTNMASIQGSSSVTVSRAAYECKCNETRCHIRWPVWFYYRNYLTNNEVDKKDALVLKRETWV
jgi:hypothetical protein